MLAVGAGLGSVGWRYRGDGKTRQMHSQPTRRCLLCWDWEQCLPCKASGWPTCLTSSFLRRCQSISGPTEVSPPRFGSRSQCGR